MSVRSAPTLDFFFVQYCLRLIWITLTRQYSDASDVVPVWSIQHCINYFHHKKCLLAVGQHYTGKNLVQCSPRKKCSTGKNPVQCCFNTFGTNIQVNTLCNVTQEIPDNISQEKTQCNVV